MGPRTYTFTHPGDIEGEPAEVAELATQQARELAGAVARFAADTFVQLRAAGIDPDDDDAVEAWLRTKPGRAAADFAWAAKLFAEAARAL
jgi:hypothetical protein